MTSDAPHTLNTTKTSFELLEALTAEGPLGVTELANQTDVSKGTIYNHLSTLCTLGYAQRVDDRYDATFRPLALSEYMRERSELYNTAVPYLDNLAKATGEYTSLFVEEEGRGTRIYYVKGSRWSSPTTNGKQTPLHVTAAGKAILASMSDDEVDETVDRFGLERSTEQTITEKNTLFQQLKEIQEDGVSFSRGERFEQINGVAAPVRQEGVGRYSAISVAGPAETLNGRYFEEDVMGQVLSTAKQIEVELHSVS